jgi:hypothetical protein
LSINIKHETFIKTMEKAASDAVEMAAKKTQESQKKA